MSTSPTKSRGRKFFKDLSIYALGNLGSKLVTFMLVPFYAHYITDPADFGYFELSLTVIFCFAPMLCMQMQDGVFRFLIESPDDFERQRQIVSYAIRSLIRNCIIFIALSIVIGLMASVHYLAYIVLYAIVHTFYEVITYILRGQGKVNYFMGAAVLCSMLTACFSLLFLAVMGMGIGGIYLATILAKSITIALLVFRANILKYITFGALDKQLCHRILTYSLPLIVVALTFWALSANSQFFIEHFLGLRDNGLYGLACRYTGIFYVLMFIFYQTWQQNSMEQYNSDDRHQYATSVFNIYFYVLCGIVVIFPYFVRWNYGWLAGPEYRSSSDYLYLNTIYVMLFSLSSFFELGYNCAKKTARILPSLIIALAISVVLNYLLIRSMHVYGVILSTICAYGFLVIYRAIDTQKYLRIRFSLRNILPVCTVVLMGIFYHMHLYVWIELLLLAGCATIYVICMPVQLKQRAKSLIFRNKNNIIS